MKPALELYTLGIRQHEATINVSSLCTYHRIGHSGNLAVKKHFNGALTAVGTRNN